MDMSKLSRTKNCHLKDNLDLGSCSQIDRQRILQYNCRLGRGGG